MEIAKEIEIDVSNESKRERSIDDWPEEMSPELLEELQELLEVQIDMRQKKRQKAFAFYSSRVFSFLFLDLRTCLGREHDDSSVTYILSSQCKSYAVYPDE